MNFDEILETKIEINNILQMTRGKSTFNEDEMKKIRDVMSTAQHALTELYGSKRSVQISQKFSVFR